MSHEMSSISKLMESMHYWLSFCMIIYFTYTRLNIVSYSCIVLYFFSSVTFLFYQTAESILLEKVIKNYMYLQIFLSKNSILFPLFIRILVFDSSRGQLLLYCSRFTKSKNTEKLKYFVRMKFGEITNGISNIINTLSNYKMFFINLIYVKGYKFQYRASVT